MSDGSNAKSTLSWRIARGLAIGLLALNCSGCAGWGSFKKNIARNQADDIGPQRETRKDQVAQDFDKRRDDAQFNAAASAWQRGDAATCEESLQQLLGRNPIYRRARLLLADLYLFNGESDKAIDELSKAVAADSKDPIAQHSLAEALDAAGRRQEALAHYEAATQLEPSNEVYSVSYKAALGVTAPAAQQHAPAQSALAASAQRPTNSARPTRTIGVPIGESTTTFTRSMTTSVKPTPPQLPIASQSLPADVAATKANDDNLNKSVSASPENAQEIAWRLSGSINDPSQPHEFENPTANMNQWLQAVHFEPAANPTASVNEAAVLPLVPKPINPTASLASATTVQVTNTVQASPSSHPVMPVVQAAIPAAEPVDSEAVQNPLQRAVSALAKGDTQAAIDAATRGISRTPDQAAPLYRVIGAAHYRRGEFQAAQAALAQALSLDKSDALACFLMGSTLAKQNEHEAAAKYLSEAARLDARFAQ